MTDDQEKEMICEKCSSPFKTTKPGSAHPKCFDCTIKGYPTFKGFFRVWSWDDLKAAHRESGAKIPCQYAATIARHTIYPIKKFIPHVFGETDVNIRMCFSQDDLKMIKGVPG